MVDYVIAFDVDGVLRSYRGETEPNEVIRAMVVAFSKFRNVKLVAWSGQGGVYAAQMVASLGLAHIIRDCYTKGDIEVDIAIDDQLDFSLGKINLIYNESTSSKKDQAWK